MAQIDHASITSDSVKIIRVSDGATIPLTLNSVVRDPVDENTSTIEFTADLDLLTPGTWSLTTIAGGIKDVDGRETGNVDLYSFPVIASPPTHDTRITGYPYDETIFINLTPPNGYAFPDPVIPFQGILYTRDGDVDLGNPVNTDRDTIAIPIGSAGEWRLELSGTYDNGDPWELTIYITTIAPVVPLNERISVAYVPNDDPATSLHPEYTLGSNDADLVFDVRFLSPENPADTAAMVASIEANAASVVEVDTKARIYAKEVVSTRIEGNSVVARFRIERSFYANTWDVTIAANSVTDGANTIPYDVVIYTLKAEYYEQGAEQWASSNPPNPTLPRLEPDASSDLMGRMIRVGGWTVSNLFDLGVRANAVINTGSDGVEDIRVAGVDGPLCVQFKEGLTDHEFNYRFSHYSQLIKTDVEVEINLGGHISSMVAFVSSNGGDKPIVQLDSSGLTFGSAQLAPISGGETLMLQGNPRGSVVLTARRFKLIEFAGTVNTAGVSNASDRRICVNYISNLKYYDVRVVRIPRYTDVIKNGETKIAAVGSYYYDPGFLVYAGELDSYDIKVNGISAPQDFSTYNDGDLFISSIYPTRLNNFFRYSTRFQDIQSGGIIGPYTVETTVNLSDGQVFEHSYTVAGDEIQPPGVYGVADGQVFERGDLISFTIGNPDPEKTISSLTLSYPGLSFTTSGVTGVNLAAAEAYSFEVLSYGDQVITAIYTYDDRTSSTYEVTPVFPKPPPEEPQPGFLIASRAEISAGESQAITWNTSPNSPFRELSSAQISMQPSDDSISLPISTEGTENYVVLTVGEYVATLSLDYADWPTAINSEFKFTAIAPPPPQNLAVFSTGGNLRVQWQEPQIKVAGVFATSYSIKLNGLDEPIIAGTLTEHPNNLSYRYADLTLPQETVQVTVEAKWGEVGTGESKSTEWQIFTERTFEDMTGGAPPELAAVYNAIVAGPKAEKNAFAASNARLAATLNYQEAAVAYVNSLIAQTVHHWDRAAISDNQNLKEAALANIDWLTGKPSYIDATLVCATQGGSACTYADEARAIYRTYLLYVKTQTDDSLLSIVEWNDAGRPTS